MSRKLFGTDGIRGQANTEPMTAATMLAVAIAAGGLYRSREDRRHLAVIGKDTRLSGYMLEPALTAGFVSIGMDVVLVGPMPTPAVAMLTRSLRADLGVVLSASHNPYHDNGIKLFGPDGYKLSDEIEAEIERRLANGTADHLAPPERLGRARRLDDAQGRYIEFVKASFPRGRRLDGLKVVVDCAHGATYKVAPTVLHELGAEVVPVAVHPDGFNINRECGAVYPDSMCSQVVAHGADLGIALDGDGDRLMLCDEFGRLVDGDQVLALIARSWAKEQRLQGSGVVATLMSNFGLERYLADIGLSLVRTQVGDRYVVEHMRQHGFNLGGEQSGHVVMSDYATTGDGLIAALQVMAVLTAADLPASEVLSVFQPMPQVLRNVRYRNGSPLDAESVKSAILAAESKLGNRGRLVVRKSGTETLIRVMAEGEDEDAVAAVVGDVVSVIERSLG
ncbi:MAG: phosphoglucosamine mutase [Proteobacteria bacterium]|nr:phosphoglucosamine mutase [Pseudomonadota bacterium]